jgi:hypothetical protein
MFGQVWPEHERDREVKLFSQQGELFVPLERASVSIEFSEVKLSPQYLFRLSEGRRNRRYCFVVRNSQECVVCGEGARKALTLLITRWEEDKTS